MGLDFSSGTGGTAVGVEAKASASATIQGKASITNITQPTQEEIMCLPQTKPARDNQYQQNDDLQLAIALSLKSQSKPQQHSISNIRMLCGNDGTLLFEESSLLIGGYIRQVTSHYIIPFELQKLCLNYFYIPTSLSKLITARNTAELLFDSYSVFETERLIFNKVCSTKYTDTGRDMCELILHNWSLNEKIEEYRDYINECILRCIRKDNAIILEIILEFVVYDSKYAEWDSVRMNQIMSFINNAAKNGAYNCSVLLLENPHKLDWTHELINPTVLSNAVKYRHNNTKLINLIISQLEAVKIKFMCGDMIMEDIIRYDLVGIAKRIVNNRWHLINESDKFYAKCINLKCNQWIVQRSNAFDYYVSNEDNIVSLEDDGWE